MHTCCEPTIFSPSLWLACLGGLLGSAHCLGMCGPLVALAESRRAQPWRPWAPLLPHAGRLLTYSAMGALAGIAGGLVQRGGLAVGIQDATAFLGGAAMILFALALLDRLPVRWGRALSQRATQRMASSLTSRRAASGLIVGLYWGLLPCGLVWAMLPGAAAMGGAIGGAAFMLSFGVGTAPALLVLAGLAGYLGARHREWLARAGAATILLMGMLLILRGAAGAGWIAHLQIAPGVPLF